MFASLTAAHAADWYTGEHLQEIVPKPHVAIDIAATADTNGSTFGTMIGTIAPFDGLNEDGFRLRLSGVLGRYSYVGSDGIGRVNGTQSDGAFLVGYEWVMRAATVAVYVGADVTDNRLSINDPNNASKGLHVGGKVAVDFYVNPTPYSMISGVVSYASANNAYYSRFKAGLAIAPQLFVGPELLVLGDNFYSQYRLGMHLTGLRLGAMQFGISGGYLDDKVRGRGGYGILDARLTF
ncbi:MAG: cellulose biosynthesis protein BcsS [Methylobacteriaceae bacterium]|nr:cellulose biosynthesis protein BcsS [Methylobacteriaceae bacterium]